MKNHFKAIKTLMEEYGVGSFEVYLDKYEQELKLVIGYVHFIDDLSDSDDETGDIESDFVFLSKAILTKMFDKVTNRITKDYTKFGKWYDFMNAHFTRYEAFDEDGLYQFYNTVDIETVEGLLQ